MSILNGPNGEFQFTPKPTETRGLGVSPTKTSRNGEIAALVCVSVARHVALAGLVVTVPSAAVQPIV
jgi:hypothetical protein